MNPVLAMVAIGLVALDLTCLVLHTAKLPIARLSEPASCGADGVMPAAKFRVQPAD